MNLSDVELERVRVLVRAYGVVTDRWPEDDQHLAATLDDERLASVLKDEGLLDKLIESCEDPVPSENLFNVVLAIPNGSTPRVSKPLIRGLWPFRALWQPLSVASLALIAGIAAGHLTQTSVSEDEIVASIEMYGLDEEITVAMGDLAFGELYIVTEIQQ